jgi:hypothetical protein
MLAAVDGWLRGGGALDDGADAASAALALALPWTAALAPATAADGACVAACVWESGGDVSPALSRCSRWPPCF